MSILGALKNPEDAPDADQVSLAGLKRIGSATVDTYGYETYISPDSLDNAIEVPIDNTKVWGVIPEDEAAAWFKMTIIGERTYHIQTSTLLSFDDIEMATKINLYDQDGTTVLETNEH